MANIRNATPMRGPQVQMPQSASTWGPQQINDYLRAMSPQVAAGAGVTAPQQGGGLTPAISGIMADYDTKYALARDANETRYQDILRQYQQRYTRSMEMLDGAGAQQTKDIDAQFQGLASRTGQDMVSRGLAGTTVGPSMQAGVERERAGAQGRLQESLTNQRLQTDANLTQDQLGFMERRTDAYPDANMYMRLMEMAQQAAQPAAQGTSLLGVNSGTNVSSIAGRATQYGQSAAPGPSQVRYNGRLYGSMSEALQARDQAAQQRTTSRPAARGARTPAADSRQRTADRQATLRRGADAYQQRRELSQMMRGY